MNTYTDPMFPQPDEAPALPVDSPAPAPQSPASAEASPTDSLIHHPPTAPLAPVPLPNPLTRNSSTDEGASTPAPRSLERERLVLTEVRPGEAPGEQPSLPNPPRKTRSDAKLLNLHQEQREELIQWLLDGMPYSEARVAVEAEFGIEVKCLTRFSEFWYRFCAPLLLKQRQQMVDAAHAHAALAPRDADALDAASFDSMRQRAYTLATAPGSNLEEMHLALAMIPQIRQLEEARERLQIDRARSLRRAEAQPSRPSTASVTPRPTSHPPEPATDTQASAHKPSSAHHQRPGRKCVPVVGCPASPRRPSAKRTPSGRSPFNR